MRTYPTNSPEALARLVCMAILADGRLDHREIELLDRVPLHRDLGLSREGFIQILLDTCRDLVDEAEQVRVHLLETARLVRLCDDVTDPDLQRRAAAAALVVAKADGRISAGEQSFLRFLLEHWKIPLDELSAIA